ncbi:MAG: class I SAM-dependent methyltransferase [Propionibacteriaceae bacterium]|nr:class I SAM-dependent methyltransferase [Propionibacteriaceae bacterium]
MFAASGAAYDDFMGRYSLPLARQFARFARATRGSRALDVGCGPGALTAELVRRLGVRAVAACDPSPDFVSACIDRNPGVEVRHGAAEALPFTDSRFDVVGAQLVLHFVPEPAAAAAEFIRVTRSGGTIAVCVWDFERGMELLRAFWDAAVGIDPDAPDEQRVMRFGRSGEIAEWLSAAGLRDVEETTLTVTTTYAGFDELWASLLRGVGPAGSYCVHLPPDRRDALRGALHERLGAPTGAITLEAVARAGRAGCP